MVQIFDQGNHTLGRYLKLKNILQEPLVEYNNDIYERYLYMKSSLEFMLQKGTVSSRELTELYNAVFTKEIQEEVKLFEHQ